MSKSIDKLRAELKDAEAEYLSALEHDLERREGSGAQERRHEERLEKLRDAVAECERHLASAKRESER